MKKVLLIISLIAVLAGIAYVKAIYSNQDTPGRVNTDRPSLSDDEIYSDYIKKEDVSAMLDSLHQYYRDSLHSVIVDSLAVLTASVQKTAKPSTLNTGLADSLENANKELYTRLERANAEIKRINQSKTDQVIKYAETFYKKELAALPADLTEYERAVSVKEIKAKMQDYFNLSSRALKQIARKYK